MSTTLSAMVLLSALGTGLMAGVYFAFSGFVMKALKTVPNTAGISSMQAINDVILGSAFMPLFFITTGLGITLALIGGLNWGRSYGPALLVAGVIYTFGMFVVTAAFNVPLNDALKAVPVQENASIAQDSVSLWQHYLKRWTLFNHIRTAASTLASSLYAYALLQS